ncbi:MAG TPA: CBS domain-containing protein [Pseudonocardiaceae bacterium]|nr:CBS domain-containing protein [Pseudonocardiaceae bacterium]
MRARDVMNGPVTTVKPDTTVKYAANVLASHGFTALPVVDADDRLIGIVTEADLVRDRFPRDARYRRDDDVVVDPGKTVGEVMTTPAVAMAQTADVVDLITVMDNDKIRSIPIVDGSWVVGIVTRRDLVRVLGRDDDDIAADVRHRLANYAGPDRWTVHVHDGLVELGDEYDDRSERHVAIVLAEAVPGVVGAHFEPTSVSRHDHREHQS